ncbi:hypothetical protein BC833DRAFT_567342 [Globomyces pollinis-pini]|nr:hypothetical protein BC833DRAFT_567342 [Globomyces pollinis-pini]
MFESKMSKLDLSKPSHIKTAHVGAALLEINQSLHGLRKQPAVSVDEMENYALQAWHLHAAYEHRCAQLKQEQEELTANVSKMWKQLESVLFPMQEVESSLLPVYKELVEILTCLNQLKNDPYIFLNRESMKARLVILQERLHKLENTYVVDGVFLVDQKKLENSTIPSGQAICHTIMDKCYKTVHELVSLNFNERKSKEPPTRLDDLNSSLVTMIGCLKAGFAFDPTLLQIACEELQNIEEHRLNGVFREDDGSVAPHQDELKMKFDLSHDLLDECISSCFDTPHLIEKFYDRSYEDLIQKASKSRDTLVQQAALVKSGQSEPISVALVKALLLPIYDGIKYFQETAQIVVTGTHKRLSSLIHSSLNAATKLLVSGESLDAKIEPLYKKLLHISERLKKIRNKHNWDLVKFAFLESKKNEIQTAYEKYRIEIDELDQELKSLEKETKDLTVNDQISIENQYKH